MTELEDAADRMRHAQSLIESVADTVEGQADVQALNRAVGLLEQAEADVADFRESEWIPERRSGTSFHGAREVEPGTREPHRHPENPSDKSDETSTTGTEDTDPTETGDRTVLTVRVATPETVFDELEERFAALDAGERPEPKHEVVVQREADLERLLNPRTLRLLRTVSREEPESIRETARLVDRDVRQVHDDLTDLERMNLLRFEEAGTAKRPVVWYDDVEVELPIADRSLALV